MPASFDNSYPRLPGIRFPPIRWSLAELPFFLGKRPIFPYKDISTWILLTKISTLWLTAGSTQMEIRWTLCISTPYSLRTNGFAHSLCCLCWATTGHVIYPAARQHLLNATALLIITEFKLTHCNIRRWHTCHCAAMMPCPVPLTATFYLTDPILSQLSPGFLCQSVYSGSSLINTQAVYAGSIARHPRPFIRLLLHTTCFVPIRNRPLMFSQHTR